MARAFASIAFTPRVQDVQRRMGSRQAYRQAETGPLETPELGDSERAFITARDSFYQGTVGENGWPYVQHRGGPAGFLKILDARTLGYADFSGNRQYISVGNLEGDGRVSLFLMDYARQLRLKIWGRARLIDEETAPALLAQLEDPGYRARVERGVVIDIEAYDWNCPKYITPRYTEDEVRALLAESAPPPATAARLAIVGDGPIELVVSGIRQLSPDVRAYELRRSDGGPLPDAPPGAHLSLPIQLPGGPIVIRQYSVVRQNPQHTAYEIAVRREARGRGASQAIHADWQLGTGLRIAPPDNHFPLHDGAHPFVLIAGGIGITPLFAMAQALADRKRPFELHYVAPSPDQMAYREELQQAYPGRIHLYASRGEVAQRLALEPLLQGRPAETRYYVCGPTSLIDDVRRMAASRGIPADHVQFESFA